MEDLLRNLGFGGSSDYGRRSPCGSLENGLVERAFYAHGERSLDSID